MEGLVEPSPKSREHTLSLPLTAVVRDLGAAQGTASRISAVMPALWCGRPLNNQFRNPARSPMEGFVGGDRLVKALLRVVHVLDWALPPNRKLRIGLGLASLRG